MNNAFLSNNAVFLLGAVAALVMGGIIALLIYRKRKARQIKTRLQAVSREIMADIVIPDGDEGQIHVEYALLTSKGIVIIDVKDVSGHIFGSDAMDNWTVLAKQRRFTFVNPQYALYDRIAAIKRLVTDVPVTGYVAFKDGGDFSKGQPSKVISLERLIEQLGAKKQAIRTELEETWMLEWAQLRETIITARADELLRS